jgi:tetratricopeptide (TPR) repeat protein
LFSFSPLFHRSLSACCALVALWLAGCGDSERIRYATEADEPYYREGQSLLKSGRRQEALAAFLKVIDKRGDDAPESHLEIGLLYQQYINDPLSAIYHFKKYLALRPNSPQAPLVKQRIDACIREFARTLPAQPLDSSAQRVDLIAAMDKLKVENELLKQQVADLKAGRETNPLETVSTNGSAETAANGGAPAADDNKFSFNVNTGSLPTVRTQPARPAPGIPPPQSPAPRNAAAPPRREAQTAQTAPATPASRTARKHTVAKGDTLMNLALRYYGNRSKWRDIYAANRGVMKSEGDLRVGMELVIP